MLMDKMEARRAVLNYQGLILKHVMEGESMALEDETI